MRVRLIIMRHAKSAWDTDAIDDHSRPLNKRGRRDAPRVAEKLVELGWRPDLVVSSDSRRTRETWAGMVDTFGDVPVTFERALYHAGLGAIRNALEGLDDSVGTVMVLGHNPGWEDAVSRLCAESVTMTTANAALLEVAAGSWAEAVSLDGAWHMHVLLRPKELQP